MRSFVLSKRIVLIISILLLCFCVGCNTDSNNQNNSPTNDITETGSNSSKEEETKVYSVIFYDEDGTTILLEDKINAGNELTLPSSDKLEKTDCKFLGFVKFDGTNWEKEIYNFDQENGKIVNSNLKFKAVFESLWSPVVP